MQKRNQDNGENSPASHTNSGIIAAIIAYFCWGIFPLYWKLLANVPVAEIIVHRGIWSLACTLVLVLCFKKMPEVRTALRGKTLLYLVTSACTMGGNWLVFTWAINANRVLETSLGNFIAPLTTVLLGIVFYKEKPRPMHIVAIALAATGVGVLVVKQGAFPWLPVLLGLSLSVYGLLRKKIQVNALVGVFVENIILFLPALGAMVYFYQSGTMQFGFGGTKVTLLLIGGGILSTIPTALYALSAQKLRLTTLGVLHYIVPTTSFILSIFVFHEPFTSTHLIAFSFIWLALIVYTLSRR